MPADFHHAYEYLEFVEHNESQVDWNLVAHEPELLVDLMLLSILHKVVHEEEQQL